MMPTCTATISQEGQTRCTGSRRTSFLGAGGAPARDASVSGAKAAIMLAGMGMRQLLCRLRGGVVAEPCETMLLERDEIRTGHHRARARSRQADGDAVDHAAGPRGHHVDLVGEVDRLLDVMGDEDDG